MFRRVQRRGGDVDDCREKISLLNSLQSQAAEAIATEEGRAALVASLREIRAGVRANLERVDERVRAERAATAALREKVAEAREKGEHTSRR